MRNSKRYYHTTGVLLVLLLATVSSAFAQDSLRLTGTWDLQPAGLPAILPDETAWSASAAVDGQIDWKWNSTAGRNTGWEKVVHDSIHSLWYRKKFMVPAQWKGNRVLVNFRRIYGDAIVFLNGRRVAELLRPGGEVELTSAFIPGKENELLVYLTRNYAGISRSFAADPLRYQVRRANGNAAIPVHQWPLGITAPVTVVCKPAQFITDVFCIPSFRKKQLSIEVEVNAATAIDNAVLQADIVDEHHAVVLTLKSEPLHILPGRKSYTISAAWQQPRYWELEQPYLYTANLRLVQAAHIIDRYNHTQFGFRELWAVGKKIFLNGHLSRWRLTDLYGSNKNGLSLYRQIGYNVGQIQPHSNLWWGADTETPLLDEEMLTEMDRIGMGCTVPAPSVAKIRGLLLSSAQAQKDYAAETAYFLKKYRNHPCIFAWVVAMNSSNPKENIWPATMGKRDTVYRGQAIVINKACAIVKQTDSTRFVFSHADGSVGDISSANVYLNFVPLQEREEWPMEWARKGNMPYAAVEFGPPYWNNFWKGNQFLLTEYLAMYQGDRAYQSERVHGLQENIKIGLQPSGSTWEKMDFGDYPSFWDFQRLFTRNTNRAWRTWGVNCGWLYWLLEGYGDPPGEMRRFTSRYKLSQPLIGKPEWANPRYSIFKEANQPLLAYIAGYPLHTDKTHTYYTGEHITKQLAIVWDGPGTKRLQATCTLMQGNTTLQQQTKTLQVTSGDIRLLPVSFAAPRVQSRQLLQWMLEIKEGNKIVQRDTLAIDVFPKPVLLSKADIVAVYDPPGKTSAWLRQTGVTLVPWNSRNVAGKPGILVIGRRALQPGDRLPYTAADVANGLRVLVMEQLPEVWEGMGFQTIETMPRYAFIRDAASPLLKGLFPRDFINWRGSPDLLPEGRLSRTYDTEKAPKWTNTHTLASVVLKTPELAGFTPILQTEFDMAYSPLLEWRYGKGVVTFCSLDLTGRVGNDPVAGLLAVQLLEIAGRPVAVTQNVYAADTSTRSLLTKLGVQVATGTVANAQAVLVASGRDEYTKAIAAKGNTVLYLPQALNNLQAQGFRVEEKDLLQIASTDTASLLRAVGPNLLRWRDVLKVVRFTMDGQPANSRVLLDGLVLEQKLGQGREIYLQVSPDLLAGRYKDTPAKKEAIQLSVIRLQQIVAQILSNLGASCNANIAERLTMITLPQTYQTLGAWKLLGPYKAATDNGDITIHTVFPGEQDAIEGAENPNNTFKRADGKVMDWRTVVTADADGFVDLRKTFGDNDELAVAYVTKTINTEKAQTVSLSLGVDFWMQAWLNGKPVLTVTQRHHKSEREFMLPVTLVKGENILTLKVASGRGGFGFWASIGYAPGAGNNSESGSVPEVKFYSPLFKEFDPYQFFYW